MSRSDFYRRVRAVALLALTPQALLATHAWAAADLPRVTLAPLSTGDGVPEKAAAKFGQLVSDELKSREEDLRWSEPVRMTAPAPAPAASTASSSKDAAEAFAAGHKLMDAQKFEEGIAALQKGIELSLANPSTADFKDVDYAMVRLAAGQYRTGEEKKGQQTLFLLARLNPEYTLPQGSFPPVFHREFEKAQRRAERSVKAKLTIEGPAGAIAYLNGRNVGTLPVKNEEVAQGTHYVRLEGSHGERAGQTLDVKGASASVKLAFAAQPAATRAPVVAAAPELRSGPVLTDATLNDAAKFCKATGIDFVVMGYVFRSSEHRLTISSALYSAKDKQLAKLQSYPFDDEVLTANVDAFRLADQVVAHVKSLGSPEAVPLALGPEGSRAAAMAQAEAAAAPAAAVAVAAETSRRPAGAAAAPAPTSGAPAAAPSVAIAAPAAASSAQAPAPAPNGTVFVHRSGGGAAAPAAAAPSVVATAPAVATPRAPAAAPAPTSTTAPVRVATAPKAPAEAPRLEADSASNIRALKRPSTLLADSSAISAPIEQRKKEKDRSGIAAVPWWVWAGGAAVVAAAATGGIYAYSQSTRPATGTATASW